MGHLSLISIAMALVMSNSYFAELNPKYLTSKSTAAYEISSFFKSKCAEKQITADVVFSVNDKREIKIHSIKTDEKEIKDYILKNFQDKKLKDGKYVTNKCYSLPVKIKLDN